MPWCEPSRTFSHEFWRSGPTPFWTRHTFGSGAFVYLEYYGLTEAPFDITPNPRFLFYSPKHREAFNHLLYGIRERKGFVQLTGEVGAGKTTLCRAMLEQLAGDYATALILNPVLTAEELMKAIAIEFGLDVRHMDRLETVAAINNFLLWQVKQNGDA